MKQQTFLRKESASNGIAKKQRKIDKVSYEVRDDDVFLLSGQYLGRSIRELFSAGPLERDYVVTHLWFTNDQSVVNVINSLCAK